MKKTILLVLLLILIVGCAKVSETKAPTKEIVKEIIAEPAAEEPEQEDSQAITVVAQEEQEHETSSGTAGATAAQMLILAGETKTLTVGDKKYDVKLMSVSNRAQFAVNGEVTKDLILNGVHILRDQSELRVLNLGYNSATIQIKLKEAVQVVQSSNVVGSSATGPQTLKSGIFITVAKTTTGNAKITRTEEEKIILQLENFRTEPGPGLYVYLANQGIADAYEIAKLVSREGGQQYDIPSDLDLNKYSKILIYSKSDGKIYGQAVLT
jgi:hypothetical protein